MEAVGRGGIVDALRPVRKLLLYSRRETVVAKDQASAVQVMRTGQMLL